MHEVGWSIILSNLIGINLGIWAYGYVARRFGGAAFREAHFTSKYTFDRAWDLCLGFFFAVALFKWGW